MIARQRLIERADQRRRIMFEQGREGAEQLLRGGDEEADHQRGHGRPGEDRGEADIGGGEQQRRERRERAEAVRRRQRAELDARRDGVAGDDVLDPADQVEHDRAEREAERRARPAPRHIWRRSARFAPGAGRSASRCSSHIRRRTPPRRRRRSRSGRAPGPGLARRRPRPRSSRPHFRRRCRPRRD